MKQETKQETQFNQLCVWPGTTLGDSKSEELEKFFMDQLNVRVKFAEEVVTLPDVDIEKGRVIEETGGRHDILFFIHDEDISKFAAPRFQYGIRWWEDVVSYNDHSHEYSQKVLDKYPVRW